MTPKEKAIELMQKYQSISVTVLGCGKSNPCIISNVMFDKSAAKCAIIAVNELLSLCWSGNNAAKDYWQEVKTEIEKL